MLKQTKIFDKNLNANYVLCFAWFGRLKYFLHTSCTLISPRFSWNSKLYHDVHKYLPWQPEMIFFASCEFINIFYICEMNFRCPHGVISCVFVQITQSFHDKELPRNDKINWIRAHILIFIIVPVQTYLFNLAPKYKKKRRKNYTTGHDDCTKSMAMSSLLLLPCTWGHRKNVIEMENLFFHFLHDLISSRICRDNSRYIYNLEV